MSWGRRSNGFSYTESGVNKQFKERLTGAVILVVFLVLVVPALLSGPPQAVAPTASTAGEGPPIRSYTIDLTAPEGAQPPMTSSPTPVITPPVAPLPAATTPRAAAVPSGAAPAGEPARSPADAPAGETGAAAPVAAAAGALATAPAPAVAPPGAPARAGDGFAVQIGSFASRANADGLVAKLRKGGFAAFISPTAGGRKLYRVRVGPVGDRDEAQRLAARLAAAGQPGKIVDLP